ncbi:MAG: DUF4296 domain-containing protein [Bacteroidota bacterium]
MLHKCLVAVLLFFISCGSKSDVPGNVLPVDEMKIVMWSMIEAGEYANYTFTKDSTKTLEQQTLKLYSKVFALHKISSEEFGRSYNYYKKHPVMEKKLLDSLQVYGNKMRESMYQRPRLELPVLPAVPADTTIKN